jgi:hypothetical protein
MSDLDIQHTRVEFAEQNIWLNWALGVTEFIANNGMNLATLCCAAYVRPKGVWWSSNSDLSITTKCDQNHLRYFVNLIPPKAGAKHKLKFNKPASRCSTNQPQQSPGNTKGGSITVQLTSCLTGLENLLYDNWKFLFLFANQTNPNQSNRRSTVRRNFPF